MRPGPRLIDSVGLRHRRMIRRRANRMWDMMQISNAMMDPGSGHPDSAEPRPVNKPKEN